MEHLPDDIISTLISRASATLLTGYPGLVAKRWLLICRVLQLRPTPVLAVTLAITNSIALLDIDTGKVLHEWQALPKLPTGPPGFGAPIGLPLWRTDRRRKNWVTGIACGTDQSIFVSQYRVHGLLQFVAHPVVSTTSRTRATRAGVPFRYERTVLTAAAPEGVASAKHGSVYTVAMESPSSDGTIAACVQRLDGRDCAVLESMTILHAYDCLWGLCLARDHYGLFIAAHADEPFKHAAEPTLHDTGRILGTGSAEE